MKTIIGFLEQLERNNNREWFQAHKSDYLDAQEKFNAVAEQIIAGIARFDPSVRGLGVKDCTYRIYRDTRFSADKRPYKTHIGAFVCPGGKKSGMAGYYFQVGPQDEGYTSGNMLAAGHYCMDKSSLRILREDICNGEGDFERILRKARPFRLDDDDKLKRVPNGYPADSPYADYLKYRTYCLAYDAGKEFMQSDDVVEKTLELFHRAYPFIEYVNRAISFTREEL